MNMKNNFAAIVNEFEKKLFQLSNGDIYIFLYSMPIVSTKCVNLEHRERS